MKKTIASLLVVVLCASMLAACGSTTKNVVDQVKATETPKATEAPKATETPKDTVAPENSEAQGTAEAPAAEATPEVTATPVPATATPSPVPTEDPLQAVKDIASKYVFSTGSVVDRSYYNEFLGVKFTPDAGWIFTSEADLKERNKDALSYLNLSEEEIEKVEAISVMCMLSGDITGSGSSVNINVERLTGMNVLLSVEKYLEVSKETLYTALTNAGMTNIVVEDCKVNFLGKSEKGLNIFGEYEGSKVYETMVVIKHAGVYMAVFTASGSDFDTTHSILGQIEKFDGKTPEAVAVDQVGEYSVGVITNNSYENEFAGFKILPGIQWQLYSVEEIKAANGFSGSTPDAEFEAAMAKSNGATLAGGVTIMQDCNFAVVSELLPEGYTSLTEDEYAEIVAPNISEQFRGAGATINSFDIKTVDFAGGKHAALLVDANLGGHQYLQAMFIVKRGDYIFVVSLSGYDGNILSELLEKITAYN